MASVDFLPPRPCLVCEKDFSPPRAPGRPPSICSAACRRKRERLWEKNKNAEAKARIADRKNAKKKEKNRLKQASYRANVTSRGNKIGAAQKLERQERLLLLVATGVTRAEATAEIGISDGTLDQWLARDIEFKRRYHMARDKARGNWETEFVPFDATFRQRFFHYPTPNHLEKLISVINEQVEIADREQRRDRRVLILLPPEHAKTTLTLEYLAYRISMDPSFRASVICSTQNQARKRIGAISRMLTDRQEYADLIDAYGPFKSEARADLKPWTADHFTHLKAPSSQIDYTLQCLGWTGSIYGDRMDIIVYDDIATMKNQTPAMIEAQWEKTWGENRSRIRKGGLFLVIGTHMREGDIYTHMTDKGFFTDTVVMPAIVREPGTKGDDDPGEALWEEGTSLEELLKLREDDLRLFELMYQQNPLPSVGAVFPLEAIESCYDPDRYIGHIPEGSLVVCGIDPSVSNYTAAVVFALRRTETGEWMRYLVDVRNEKDLTGDGGDNHRGVVDFIVDVCRDYQVHTLCVEDGAWMSLINNAFTLRSKLYDLGVRHIPIKATEQTVGPEAIRQLSGLFNHRLISIPATPSSKAHLHEFVNQLLTWTGEKQHWRAKFDIVKALRQAEHAVRMATRHGKPSLVSSYGSDHSGFLEEVSVA